MGYEERGTGNRERRMENGKAENEDREKGNGERRKENGTQRTGTRNQGPSTGNGKMKMEKNIY